MWFSKIAAAFHEEVGDKKNSQEISPFNNQLALIRHIHYIFMSYDMQPLMQDVHIILNEKTPKQTP